VGMSSQFGPIVRTTFGLWVPKTPSSASHLGLFASNPLLPVDQNTDSPRVL